MQTTLELLEKALEQRNASEWAAHLRLTASALRTARTRGHLSPAIAGALAEEMGLDAQKWIVIAALESERESACKSRMVRKFLTGAALAGTLIGASGAATASVAAVGESVSYVKYQRGECDRVSAALKLSYFSRALCIQGSASSLHRNQCDLTPHSKLPIAR